jgi:NAD(P)-dependent dehydrogenase (short-subunit alcohol dehydrogenase family)
MNCTKRAMVTGATGGLGKAIADAFSDSARDKIAKAGGTAELVQQAATH